MEKVISIGSTSFTLNTGSYYSTLFDEDGELMLRLRFIATEKEAMAAYYGFMAGFKQGKEVGHTQIKTEFKQLLGIPLEGE